MERRKFIQAGTLAGFSLTLTDAAGEPGKKKGDDLQKKNMLWIFGDQHRAQALGYMGDPNARTPFLNDLSLEGTTFTDAVSGCPWCTPFRGSLFTSKYNHQCVYRTPQHLNKELPLVTDVFNDNGYLTAFFGKWHLFGSNKREFVPREERGRFKVWLGYENNNKQYDSWIHGHDIWGRDDKIADAEKLDKYESDALTDHLLNFLAKRPKDKPFFAVLSVQPPHDPFVAPPEYMKHFDAGGIQLRPNVPQKEEWREEYRKNLAGYYAQIENLDYNVGRIRKVLKDLNLEDSTNIAFFSDHGDCHGSHGFVRKSSPWEEAIRIPCLFKPAGKNPKQRFSDVPFNHVDFSPTSLGLCGIEKPEWMSGTDLSSFIIQDRPSPPKEPDSVFLQHIFRKRFDCLNRPWRGIRTRDGWKYIVLEGQPIMMFNLKDDPFEMTNLVYLDEFNERRKALHEKLENWITETGDVFLMPEL
jgi:arylsulfatase A-like enzyme